jgi:DNA replication protein DnaC
MMDDAQAEDLQLAAIAARARERMGVTSSPEPGPDPFARAVEKLGESLRIGDPPPSVRSPSTPPSSEPGARGRALLARSRESIPARFQWARFDDPVLPNRVGLSPERLSEARVFASDPPNSLLLVGGTGAGKTTLACAVLHEIIDLGLAAHARRTAASAGLEGGALAPFVGRDLERFRRAVHCRFVTAYQLARAHSEAPLGEEPRIVYKARTASVLVLDDLGMDSAYKRSSCVRDVIHERDANCRPTIVTTYLKSPEIDVQYGAGIRRRLGDGAVLTLSRASG